MPKATTTTATAPKTTERTRWGAGMLVLGSLLAMASLTAFLTRPGLWAPVATQRLAAIASNPGALQLEGYLGVAGYILVALAAFFLVSRENGAKNASPAAAFWIPVGLGAALLVGVEATVAVAIAPLAAGVASAPLLVTVVSSVVNLVAGVGILAIGAGLTMVLWTEARAAKPALAPTLLYVGVAGSLGSVVGAFAFITGVRELLVAFYATYLSYLVVLVLAAKMAYPDMSLSGAATMAEA